MRGEIPLFELRISADEYGAVTLHVLTLVHAEKDRSGHSVREVVRVPLNLAELQRIAGAK